MSKRSSELMAVVITAAVTTVAWSYLVLELSSSLHYPTMV